MHNYNKCGVRILIVAIMLPCFVANVTEDNPSPPPPAQTSPVQVILAHGIYREHLWKNSWFQRIADVEDGDLMEVDRLIDPQGGIGVTKKVRLIPTMMGCNYGVRFNWFLSLAVSVIGECNELSVQQLEYTDHCWDKLRNILQRGSYAALEVSRSLEYVHSVVANQHITDTDVFYRIVSEIRNCLRVCSHEDRFAGTHFGLLYGDELNRHTINLFSFLISNCQPEFQPVLLEQIMYERYTRAPASYDYEFYVKKMEFHVQFIRDHLTGLGFHYNLITNRTTYNL